jgi:hypothetical protein
MAPKLFDLTWKSSASQEDLPTDVYPTLGPAIYRNDSYSIRFILTDEDDAPYVPVGTMSAQIRRARLKANATPGDPLADFTVDIAGDDGNEVTISLVRDQAAALPDEAFWDLQEAFDEDDARTWFTGKVKAWGDISRDVS